MTADEILTVCWVKLHGCKCPSYPVHVTPKELHIFVDQIKEGDAILVFKPLKDQEGQEFARASP